MGEHADPGVVVELVAGGDAELVWRNELGGLTFRVADGYLKWNPRRTGIDLAREIERLGWIATRHPTPRVLDHGADDLAQWVLTAALPGEPAVGDRWRVRRPEAIAAIATGLRTLHALATDDFPTGWTEQVWVGRRPASLGPAPAVLDPVVVHGDACAPNTLISTTGEWVGNVDFGDLAIGDRWADLAIASLSLDRNFGAGHHHELYDACGIRPDEERIRYYRALWHLES